MSVLRPLQQVPLTNTMTSRSWCGSAVRQTKLTLIVLLLQVLSVSHCTLVALAEAPPVAPRTMATNKLVLLRGAGALGFAVVFSSLFAGGAAGIAKNDGCTGSDDGSFRLCFGHSEPARAALISGIVTFDLLAPLAVSSEMLRTGERNGTSASRVLVTSAAYVSLGMMTLFSIWAIGRVASDGPRVVAPIATLLIVGSIVTPLSFGYLTYRLTEHSEAKVALAPFADSHQAGATLRLQF
jgi:hypothetical protein